MRAGLLLLLSLVLLVPACSKEALMRGSYETLHNVSDIQNEIDPKYDPGPRPDYDVYRQQREELLHPAPAPVVPTHPGAPAEGAAAPAK